MSYVVTLENFTPPPRYDSLPWTDVEVQESASRDGTFATIDTITLVPDVDPSKPQARDVTTELATMPAAWYRLIFVDGTGDQATPTDAVFNGASITYRPSITDVAVLIRSRTKDNNGNELGTFTDDTRPTGSQVESLIDQATRRVAQRVGIEVDDSLVDQVRDLVALLAASWVERSYFPEQIGTDRSMYDVLLADYNVGMPDLMEAVREVAEGGQEGVVDEPELAVHTFPVDVGGIVGWNTRF